VLDLNSSCSKLIITSTIYKKGDQMLSLITFFYSSKTKEATLSKKYFGNILTIELYYT